MSVYRINVGFSDAAGTRYGILLDVKGRSKEDAVKSLTKDLQALGLTIITTGAINLRSSVSKRPYVEPPKELSLETYAESALSGDIYPQRRENPYFAVLAMCSEAGEVAGKYQRAIRDHAGTFPAKLKEGIEKELGDLLWGITAIADEVGSSLATVAQKSIMKLTRRFLDGTLSGEGDDR